MAKNPRKRKKRSEVRPKPPKGAKTAPREGYVGAEELANRRRMLRTNTPEGKRRRNLEKLFDLWMGLSDLKSEKRRLDAKLKKLSPEQDNISIIAGNIRSKNLKDDIKALERIIEESRENLKLPKPESKKAQ